MRLPLANAGAVINSAAKPAKRARLAVAGQANRSGLTSSRSRFARDAEDGYDRGLGAKLGTPHGAPGEGLSGRHHTAQPLISVVAIGTNDRFGSKAVIRECRLTATNGKRRIFY